MLLLVSMPLSHTCGQTDVQTSSEQRECDADWLASGESKIAPAGTARDLSLTTVTDPGVNLSNSRAAPSECRIDFRRLSLGSSPDQSLGCDGQGDA